MLSFQEYRTEFKANIGLALPIMVGQLGQIAVNLADNLMVGRLGSVSLAAVSVANSILIVFIVVGMGISFALPPLVSAAVGARQPRRISQFFKHSLYINMGFAIASSLLILIGLPLLDHLGQVREVISEAKPYLVVSALSLIPFMLFQTLRCYCDGMGRTRIPMYAIIFGNAVNIGLNYFLIFGYKSIPSYGVTGAAIASFIARVLMTICLFLFIHYQSELFYYISKARYNVIRSFHVKKIFSLGIPTSLQMFFEVSAFSGAALMMGLLGDKAQAAHQVSINLASITFLICTGVSMAATVRVGKFYGAENEDAQKVAGISAIMLVTIFMGITAFLFVAFRQMLPSLYINDPNVEDIAATLLIMAAVFQIPDGVQVTALGALRGVQDVWVPTVITFIAYWIFGLPFSYYSAIIMKIGPAGIWLGLIIGLSISACFLTYRFLRISNRTKLSTNNY